MPSSRAKGKSYENTFAKTLRKWMPAIRTARATQSYDGGNDFVNCDPFNIEVKGGQSYKLNKWFWDALKQCRDGGEEENINVVCVGQRKKERLYIFAEKDFIKFMDTYF